MCLDFLLCSDTQTRPICEIVKLSLEKVNKMTTSHPVNENIADFLYYLRLERIQSKNHVTLRLRLLLALLEVSLKYKQTERYEKKYVNFLPPFWIVHNI